MKSKRHNKTIIFKKKRKKGEHIKEEEYTIPSFY